MVSTNNQLKLMKTKQNSRFSSSPKVPHKEKSTHESFVVLDFQVAGRRMFLSPRAAPSNPFCPVAWYPRKPCGESL